MPWAAMPARASSWPRCRARSVRHPDCAIRPAWRRSGAEAAARAPRQARPTASRSATPPSACAWRTSRARRCAAAATPRCGRAIESVAKDEAAGRDLRRQYRRADGDVDVPAAAPSKASTVRPSRPCGRPSAARRSCSMSAPISNATRKQLVDFAVMGEAFARAVLGLERPSVGLLNVGAEEHEGS